MGKKPKGFNNPFADIKKQVPAPPAPAPKPAPKVEPAPSVSDERLFEDEMGGVQPLAPDPRGRLNAPPPTAPRPPRSRREGEDSEAYAQLADLIDGVGPFEVSDGDETFEGLAPGIDRRLLKNLKKGDYALQAQLDLHGLTSEEARGEVERFIDHARNSGKRCVLIIHGRGHNSADGIPVLKERLKVWLTRGRSARAVLAFCTARPHDGGAGALYLLLRK